MAETYDTAPAGPNVAASMDDPGVAELHQRILREFEDAFDASYEERTRAEQCRDYYDSFQWTEEEIGVLRKRKQPIVGWTWEPFWLPALYEGEFVAWPEYEDACYDDPAWGPNPDKAYDCGRPRGFMWKSAWAGGEAIWPKAYDVWRKFTLDAQTMGELVYKSDVEGVPTETVAEQWVVGHEDVWKPWLE